MTNKIHTSRDIPAHIASQKNFKGPIRYIYLFCSCKLIKVERDPFDWFTLFSLSLFHNLYNVNYIGFPNS